MSTEIKYAQIYILSVYGNSLCLYSAQKHPMFKTNIHHTLQHLNQQQKNRIDAETIEI